MRGNNFGGLKGVGPEGGSAVYLTREGQGPRAKRIFSRFRVYPTPEAGARDYVRTLAEKYPEAIQAARTGSAHRFVFALERRGYFTASAEAYLRAIRSLAREFGQTRLSLLAQRPALGVSGTAPLLGAGTPSLVPERR